MIPILQLLQGQGIEFDARRYLEIQSELLDVPRLLEVFRFDGSSQAVGADQNRQAAKTTRENVRTNVRGGATPEAQSQNMMSQLMGQMDEQPTNGQPVGSY